MKISDESLDRQIATEQVIHYDETNPERYMRALLTTQKLTEPQDAWLFFQHTATDDGLWSRETRDDGVSFRFPVGKNPCLEIFVENVKQYDQNDAFIGIKHGYATVYYNVKAERNKQINNPRFEIFSTDGLEHLFAPRVGRIVPKKRSPKRKAS